ncbi:MAG: hypothetical protein EOP06_07880 [Proteobacteria bacterium]|nr:MAG: hypothetical protein EOP06_07880 [Pseudomonadota bacterium]
MESAKIEVMKFHRLALIGALCAVTPLAFAAPKTAGKPKTAAKPKLVTLHYCPTSGEKLGSMGESVGGTTYKNYKISFCCGGCPEAFAKLSPKEKDAKIAEIVKKQNAEKKG